MRRPEKETSQSSAWKCFEQAPFGHLAALTSKGEPLLRALHIIPLPEGLFFHSGPVGEKTELEGRPAVLSAEKMWAEVPSSAFHDEHACPATSLYDSAQAKGILRKVKDQGLKARVLQRLMERLQPEGGYRPLSHQDPHYIKSLQLLDVVGLFSPVLTGKSGMLQNKSPAKRSAAAEALWRRGSSDDLAALTRLLLAHPQETPLFLKAPRQMRLVPQVHAASAFELLAVLKEQYWNVDVNLETLTSAHQFSNAWVGLEDENGTLIGSARAISDGAKRAWIYDVIIDDVNRGVGLGKTLMLFLLDHPALRHCQQVLLGTKDAVSFYEKLGFQTLDSRRRAFQVVTLKK